MVIRDLIDQGYMTARILPLTKSNLVVGAMHTSQYHVSLVDMHGEYSDDASQLFYKKEQEKIFTIENAFVWPLAIH